MRPTASRLKVLLASRAPFVGGAEVAAERLALGLNEAGHEVLLVLGALGPVAERCQRAGLRWLHLPLPLTDRRHWWSYWQARRAFRALLRKERPDLVHSNDLPTHQFVSGVARDVPRICHHRFVYDGPTVDWFNKYGAEHHIFISQALQHELCARATTLAAARRTQVYDGLPLPDLPPPGERAARRERLGLPTAASLVVFAGQIIPIKGLQDLLLAWPHLSEAARAQTQLLVLGDDLQGQGRYRREMEELARQVNCPARFLGFRDEVREYLLAADVAVVPSHVEPLSLATLEAMACALPVVGCAVGGIREIIRPEETGLLVPPQAPAELAAALDRLLADAELRARLGQHGRRRCDDTFSLSAHVRAVLQVYDEELALRWPRRS
jgi:glycosyltransferase involved in cell wall biosynthesis